MAVPILKQGAYLIASVQSSLTDAELRQLQEDLVVQVGRARARGVVIDLTPLDVLDSFATRTLVTIAHALRLRGTQTIVVGIQPDVAYGMVRLGLTLEGVETALDLDEGLERLGQLTRRGGTGAR